VAVPPPVAVTNGCVAPGAAVPPGHFQGVHDQLAAGVVGDGPAHDHPRPHIEYGAAVDLPFTGGVLGDVGAPNPVRALGNEPAAHQVLVHRRGRRYPP